ncbi:hypothetical protein TSMEX_007399 [Taenia solium]|eukprot:TsM_000467800 transcript=TsM_000467800 gene=TsM_000467800
MDEAGDGPRPIRPLLSDLGPAGPAKYYNSSWTKPELHRCSPYNTRSYGLTPSYLTPYQLFTTNNPVSQLLVAHCQLLSPTPNITNKKCPHLDSPILPGDWRPMPPVWKDWHFPFFFLAEDAPTPQEFPTALLLRDLYLLNAID